MSSAPRVLVNHRAYKLASLAVSEKSVAKMIFLKGACINTLLIVGLN
jgi:hypothetical protein